MRRVILVTGPPCAGKTTYARTHAGPADLILDQDDIGARAMTTALASIPADRTTWVIRCAPGPTARTHLARSLGAEVVHLAPPREELIARATRRAHPRRHIAAVNDWIAAELADALPRQRLASAPALKRSPPESSAGRKGRAWRTLCAQVYADPAETHCIRCGQPVDKDLISTHAPPELRRWARSVDHIIAIDQGGARQSRDNVAIAHYGCNARHGAKVRWAKERGTTASRVIVDVDPHSL